MNTRHFKFVMVVLALAAPLVAVCGYGQQNNGSPDGLYAVPDSDQAARDKKQSPSNRAADSYLDSLDAEGQRIKSESEHAEAVRRATLARKSAHGLAASQGADWIPSAFDLTERGWIVTLTALGLLISFAAAGFVWWNQSQAKKTPVAVFMPMRAAETSHDRRD